MSVKIINVSIHLQRKERKYPKGVTKIGILKKEVGLQSFYKWM